MSSFHTGHGGGHTTQYGAICNYADQATLHTPRLLPRDMGYMPQGPKAMGRVGSELAHGQLFSTPAKHISARPKQPSPSCTLQMPCPGTASHPWACEQAPRGCGFGCAGCCAQAMCALCALGLGFQGNPCRGQGGRKRQPLGCTSLSWWAWLRNQVVWACSS